MKRTTKPIRTAINIACWLLNIVIACALLWISWLSSLLGRMYTDIARQTLLDRSYDDAYWANFRTIEEAWPQIVSTQEVPYYYKQLIDAAKLLDEVGYADHKARLKPYMELTPKERKLLARRVPVMYESFGSEKYEDWELIKFLDENAYYETTDKRESQQGLLDMVMFSDYQNAAIRNSQISAIEARVASPISDLIIWVRSLGFSPGDAFSERLSEGEAKRVRKKDVSA